MLILWLF